MIKQHWFFDFDGTLCDTEADIKNAWRAALKTLGRDCPQFDRIYKTGPTIDQVVYMLFDDATPALVEQIRACFKTFYDASGFPGTRPYPWVPAWLAELKSQARHIYVATNKRYAPTMLLMEKLGWTTRFDGVFSFDMYPGEQLKKADLLMRVMKARAIDASDAVMVGDTAGDVAAGRGAGVATIGCTWGYGTRKELEGADEIYDASRFSRESR
ncbi:MAG: HAD family hydrolase [Kiritimatiellia bacterium]